MEFLALASSMAASIQGARIRVGGADAQVRGGTRAHVVAEHARPGLPLPVSASFTATLLTPLQ